mgnify:FL=1
MQLKDILKLQSTIDNKKTPEDIEKMMNRMLWSESKQTMIKIGDMHLDHYLRKVHNKLLDDIEPSTDELIEKLKGRKFFIVRWCGDESAPTSNKVEDPIKFFSEQFWGDDVLKDLAEIEVGQKYNVDEMMQDIEILRYE